MSAKYHLAVLLFFLLVPAAAFAQPATIDGLLDVKPDGRLVIVAFGDSLTFGTHDNGNHRSPIKRGYPGRLRKLFPSATIINSGIAGETTYTGKRRAQRLFQRLLNADYVIVLEGVNDRFVRNHSGLLTRRQLVTILQYAQATGAQTLLAQLLPTKRLTARAWVRQVNDAIEDIASIEFSAFPIRLLAIDGIHPGPAGYTVMSEIIANALLDLSASLTATPTPTPTPTETPTETPTPTPTP